MLPDIPALLATLREERHWSRAELARRAKMHPSTISWAESGKLVLGLSQLAKLAKALQVPRKTLLESAQLDVKKREQKRTQPSASLRPSPRVASTTEAVTAPNNHVLPTSDMEPGIGAGVGA